MISSRVLREVKTAMAIGTTAANFFFDATGAQGQAYFYWVRAENGAVQSALSSADQGTRATGEIGSSPFPPLEPPVKNRKARNQALVDRALRDLEEFASATAPG